MTTQFFTNGSEMVAGGFSYIYSMAELYALWGFSLMLNIVILTDSDSQGAKNALDLVTASFKSVWQCRDAPNRLGDTLVVTLL